MPASPQDLVRSRAAVEEVVARAAVDLVAAGAAHDPVIAGAAADDVLVALGDDHVIAAAGDDHLDAVLVGLEDVVAATAHDRGLPALALGLRLGDRRSQHGDGDERHRGDRRSQTRPDLVKCEWLPPSSFL